MTGSFKFENFSTGSNAQEQPQADIPETDPRVTEAYEKGYSAGWDDATKASEADAARVSFDLAENLRSIVLSGEDIRASILMSLQPVLSDLVSKVLPSVSNQTLGPRILQEIQPLIDETTDASVQIVVNPENQDEVSSLLDRAVDVPVQILAENAIGHGQVFLRVGAIEKSVDMEEVLSAIQAAVSAYFENEFANQDEVPK